MLPYDLFNFGNLATVTQVNTAANVAIGNVGPTTQSISQSNSATVSQPPGH